MTQVWPLAFGFAVIVFSGVGASAYTRPPPGRILTVKSSESDSQPQQVRISIANSDQMRISWITKDKNLPSLVEYGKTPGVYDSSASGESTSYRFFFYTSGNIHHVEIGPLDANTTYYYRCGGVGGEFTFKTPPSTLPIEFVLIGDLGQTEWTASTLSHINYSDYDILLLAGDLSYADSQQPLWDSFALLVQPQASRRPWMVTQGNHEIESLFPIFRIHPFAAYNARWRMPFEQSSSTSNLFYSFDAAGGEAHVLMLGSYAEYGVKSQQYKWLKADLAMLDRRKTPWLLAIVHAPWYNTNDAHQREGEGMRKNVEKLLFDAKVDIVFGGHVHAYERFTRIYDNAANPCGPIYITIGDGGNREGLAYNFNEKHSSANLSVFREASFGHGRLKVLDKKRAHWTWHRNNNSNPDVGDELWIESLSSSASCMTVQSYATHYNDDEL
ncbi:purple acid phosphatase 22 isoform X1 [Dendrobium catenatum]|uniref:purple acid phosphatase 22 isoform X1 n=1 Tax=Dendrobium catenatum TaxID=906689 RepID=UPI00109FB8C7|nr:purple acid phosphatase 22 isoform X1 [Dendrobium catenatum]